MSLNSTRKQISDLPVEVLEKIMEFAVGDSKIAGFLNPSLVCKQWNHIVSNSQWIMSQLSGKIEIRTDANAVNIENFKITRDYRDFQVSGHNFISKNYDLSSTFPAIISSLTRNLRKLSLFGLALCEFSFSALRSLGGLHCLSFCHCSCPDDVIRPVTLENMEHLEVTGYDATILNWLTCKELDSITFAGSKLLSPPVVTFLNNIERVDEISMRVGAGFVPGYDPSNSSWVLKPKFKWNKLNASVKHRQKTLRLTSHSTRIRLITSKVFSTTARRRSSRCLWQQVIVGFRCR